MFEMDGDMDKKKKKKIKKKEKLEGMKKEMDIVSKKNTQLFGNEEKKKVALSMLRQPCSIWISLGFIEDEQLKQQQSLYLCATQSHI